MKLEEFCQVFAAAKSRSGKPTPSTKRGMLVAINHTRALIDLWAAVERFTCSDHPNHTDDVNILRQALAALEAIK